MDKFDYSADVSVLFIVFNRLETTKKVFEVIKKAEVPRLYIASDGPRIGKNEDGLIEQVRSYILNNISWKCEIFTLFRDKNLNCGPSVKNAIDWFFEHEERGIILEDDVVPRISFFRYCEELLEKYKDDDRIGMISGNNFINDVDIEDSYLFSKFKNTWGWATWRRAWNNMDLDMNWKKTIYKSSIIKNMGYSDKSTMAWEHILFTIKYNLVSAWDYQWSFALGAHNQLSIVPKVNLVSNIGFGDNSTHTSGKAKDEYSISHDMKFPLKHPKYIICYMEYEKKYEDFMYASYTKIWYIKFKIKRLIKLLIGRFI